MDKPMLPSVKSLLNIGQADDYDMQLPPPRTQRHPTRSSPSYHHPDDARAAARRSDPHQRNRISSHRTSDKSHQPSSSTSRARKPDAPLRASSSARRHHSTHHSQHLEPLPSVHEVLGRRNAPLTTEHIQWPPLADGSHRSPDDSAHRGSSSSSPASPPKKQGYPCERCGRLFTRKSDALKHIRVVHDRLKVFACQICDRRFARKDYCTKHERSLHNVIPPPTPYQMRRKLAKQRSEDESESQGRSQGK